MRKRNAKTTPKESAVLSACIRWLYTMKVFAWRNNSGAYKTTSGHYVRYGYKGSSDILAIQPNTGKIICIECKREGEKQTPEQKEFEQRVKDCGGVYIVARSLDDMEESKSLILGYSPAYTPTVRLEACLHKESMGVLS